MINTQFGSEVEMLWLDQETGDCSFMRKSDAKIFRDHVGCLRADGGLGEILAEAAKAEKKRADYDSDRLTNEHYPDIPNLL